MKYINYITLSLLLLLSACRSDIDDFYFETTIPAPLVLVESSLRGQVVNEDGEGMSNVLVEVDDHMLWTDANGRFHFKNLEVKKGNSLVVAETGGYFKGSSLANFRAAGTSYVEITMMTKGLPKEFDSTQDAELVLNKGVELSIPKNIIRTTNGNIHNGPVKVYSRYLDPTADNIRQIMPGALNATAANGDPLALLSYGMVVFEMETVDGLALSIAEGESAQMKIPIPETTKNDAPNEIDLWYFDLEEEQWLLEGKCESDGDYYYATVTTTGTWNCDVPVPAICLSGQIFNSDSTFASYLQVIVEDTVNNFVYWGYTDSTGYFCGSVPQDAVLLFSIVDHCDTKLYCETIGPFAEDFQLLDIYLEEVVQTYFINIKGTVSHCMTNDIANGHVSVVYPGATRIFPFENGSFDFDLALLCVDFPEMQITVYSNSQPYASETYIHSDFSDLDLMEIILCEPLTEYINLTAEGIDYWASPVNLLILPPAPDFGIPELHWFQGLSGSGSLNLKIDNYAGAGTYTEGVRFFSDNKTPLPDFPELDAYEGEQIEITVTEDNGEYITGEYNGSAINEITGQTIPISGDFRVRIPE